MNSRSGIVLSIIAGVIVLAALSAFTVDQRQRAIVFQLGEIKDLIDAPGLYFKFPLIQNVRYFDKRILTLDTADTERFIRALHHLGEEKRPGRLLRQVAHPGHAAVLHQRPR